jgi:2-polyprenyl-6-methoxyphenol hydroxylase-like FAD-dependent oxidoreductase
VVAEHPDKMPLKTYLGSKISHFDIENARIRLHDGRIFIGDLLIGAVGILSAVSVTAFK